MSEKREVILVVDDEPAICWALERILTKMGFQTVTASNGRDALGIAGQSLIRLAFVDVKIPDMDGIDLAGRLRGIQPNLPVVLVSGYFYEEDRQVQSAIRGGLIRGFISKPFMFEQIREAAKLATPSVSAVAEAMADKLEMSGQKKYGRRSP